MNLVNIVNYEREYIKKGLLVSGVDEAGRGPLAGPVTACALIPNFKKIIKGVNDSKKLTDKRRRELYPEIIANAYAYKTVSVSHEIIDKINILEATKNAMKEGIESLFPVPHIVLIDAVRLNIPYKSLAIIHGDALCYAIAAASIIAKVDRDDIMIKYAETYPEYGFEEHKGYCTERHVEMLKKYGPCPIHRTTFLKKVL
jgi:Ribonuclease HII